MSELLDESVHLVKKERRLLVRTIKSGARVVSVGMDIAVIPLEHEGRTVANSDDNDLRHGSHECLDTKIMK